MNITLSVEAKGGKFLANDNQAAWANTNTPNALYTTDAQVTAGGGPQSSRSNTKAKKLISKVLMQVIQNTMVSVGT